jgi:hypothetical protein
MRCAWFLIFQEWHLVYKTFVFAVYTVIITVKFPSGTIPVKLGELNKYHFITVPN